MTTSCHFLRVVVATLILPAIGCSGGKRVSEVATRHGVEARPDEPKRGTESTYIEGNKAMIEPEQVRAALLKLVAGREKTEPPAIHRELDILRKNPITDKEGSSYRIGDWRIDPKQNTFEVTFTGLPFLLQYTGKFDKETDGTWQAVISQRFQGPVDPSKVRR
jgi:hypothetical protein